MTLFIASRILNKKIKIGILTIKYCEILESHQINLKKGTVSLKK